MVRGLDACKNALKRGPSTYHVEWLLASKTRDNSQMSRNGEKELQQAGASDMAALLFMLNPTSPTPPCAISDATRHHSR